MEPSEPASAPRPCPACKGATLEEVEDRGVAFLGCAACKGLFVANDGLAAYVADAVGAEAGRESYHALLATALEGRRSGSVRACPVCTAKLERFGFGDAPFVILDRCPEHGLWLDRPELRKVVRASRARAAAQGLVAPELPGEDHQDEA